METIQSIVISEFDQIEEKLPENPYELRNIFRILQNYQQTVRRNVQKSAIINHVILKILQKISSKIAHHEANFRKWTPQDVVMSVCFLNFEKF